MFDDPQVLAEDMITTFEHPKVGQYRGVRGPIKFGRTPGPEAYSAPNFGQHSDAVAIANDLSAEEITSLRAKGPLR